MSDPIVAEAAAIIGKPPIRLEDLPEDRRAMFGPMVELLRARAAGDTEPDAEDPTAEPDGGLFTDEDLTGRSLVPGRRFPIPGTKKHVYVHALTDYEAEQGILWVARQLAELPETTPEPQRNARQAHLFLRAQVLMCCRRTAEPGSRPIFRMDRADVLAQTLPYETIKRIVTESDAIGRGEEYIGEAAKAFFVAIEGALSAVCGASSTWRDCPAGLKSRLTALLSDVQRLNLLGKFLEAGD